MSFTILPAGSRVEIRDEEWIIRQCKAISTGGYEIHVTGTSELVRGHQAVFLSTLDQIAELRPEATILAADNSPGYRKAKLYLDALLKRTPPVDTALSIGPLAAINPAPYQLEPSEKVFGLGRYHDRGPQLRPRLLIADAVGLGKTIEVGILVTELIKRGRGDRILCLAKKSMLAQFQQELWARFSIPLVRLDSIGIARLRSRIPSNRNPFSCYNRIIISIDTLKDTKASTSYRHYLETFPWDIVIIDEAHNCANPGTANNTLAHRVCANAEAVILTTATPHNGKPRSFAELIRLLDPTAIADLENYEADDIAPYFIRRFKKDVIEQVGEHFRDRLILPIRSPAQPGEEAIYARLGDLRLRSISDSRNGQDHLVRWVLLKAYLSSPVAAAETLAHRLTELRRRHTDGGRDNLAEHIADLESLHADLACQTITDTARYAALLTLLKDLTWKPKGEHRIILFTESRRTQDALATALRTHFKADEDQIQIIHGGMTDLDQSRIVDDFGKGDTPVRLLIATDVASEGVNLHYQCHLLIHYDLPWSLIRLEQRNGRIDRYGQTQNPRIHYLLTISKCPAFQGDQRILDALIEKEQWVYRNTGDAAGVMQFHSVEDEERAIGEGAARGLAPEQVLAPPDTPETQQAKLLEQLLKAAQRLDAAAPPANTPATSTWPSLFADDLAFTTEAWATVMPDVALDKHPQRPQIDIKAPDDLWLRCGGSLGSRGAIIPGATAIPDEARPDDRTFVLTTDRAAVMDAIHRARVLAKSTATSDSSDGPKKRGRPGKSADAARPIDDLIALAPELRSSWPRLHLLWEQHPVVQWLLDQVLIHFGRGEAPLLHAAHLPPRTAYAVIRGSYPNRNGRETIVDWFAVRFVVERTLPPQEFAGLDIVPMRQALTDLRLDRIGPTGREPDVAAAVQSWLPFCVNAAQQHLTAQRATRGQSLSRPLNERKRRLNAWADKARDLIAHKQERLDATAPAFKAHLGRLNQERAKIDRILKAQQEWLERTMRTSDTSVLQVAMVIVGPGVSP